MGVPARLIRVLLRVGVSVFRPSVLPLRLQTQICQEAADPLNLRTATEVKTQPGQSPKP